MAKRIDAGLRDEIANAYLSDKSVTVKALAEKYHYSVSTISKIINEYTTSGKDIKPDRRKESKKLPTDAELDRQHDERMAEKHPRSSDWMQHITPLHQRKQELENTIEHKQAELDKARQEYRDFLATLRQLMEETV